MKCRRSREGRLGTRRHSQSSTPFSGFRLSPTLATNIAGCPLITHLLVQIPHPIQSSRLTRGCFTVTFSPVSVVTCASSNQMAFLGVGQCSSQTMHVRALAYGRQRLRSMYAKPILIFCFSATVSGRMAPVGQTWVHNVHSYSQ